MRPVLTKGRGDRMHHQDQHRNSQVIVAGEQYVHCLLEHRVTEAGDEYTTRENWAKSSAFWDILAGFNRKKSGGKLKI